MERIQRTREKLMIMKREEFDANVAYLEQNEVSVSDSPAYDRKKYSRELYMYTDGGGDFSLAVECLTRKDVLITLDCFDVNEETLLWWNGRGVPFNNIKDLYEDIENWKLKFIKIADGMPY